MDMIIEFRLENGTCPIKFTYCSVPCLTQIRGLFEVEEAEEIQ